jgi:Fe-S-cluster containining protein
MAEPGRASSGLDKKEPLAVPPSARAIHRTIVLKLRELNGASIGPCTGQPFLSAWLEIGGLVERYQGAIVDHSPFKRHCAEGCSVCCNHWVDEVYSFEAEIIADYLRKRHHDEIPEILTRCREDIAVLARLNGLVEQKLAGDEAGPVDARDLLLSVYYQMRRPCPLLENNVCIVYPVRPLTCRNYVGFSDARFCDPEHINGAETATYLFGLEGEAVELMESLHEKYKRFEGESGLRAALAEYLA